MHILLIISFIVGNNYFVLITKYFTITEIVAMAEWWSNSRCNLWGEEEALRMFGKEHCMVVMNHKYDVDWLMCWFICDKLGMLGVSIFIGYLLLLMSFLNYKLKN